LQEDQVKARRQQSSPHSAFGTRHSRILLADDNADMREYLRQLLAGQYEVEAVADGEQALKAARERPFDLILTDVMMPRLDGFGLLSKLRGDERTREVPIILLSARAGEASKIQGLEAGADDYLVKPFSPRELLAIVEARLQIQRVRRQSQDTLLASERKFSAAFNQSPLPMIITSLDDRRVTEVNESFVRLSGHTREEAVGRTSDELRLLAEWEQRDEGLKAIRAGERVYRFEARFLTKSGEERTGMITSSVVEINSRPFLLHSFTDLTERKRGEQALAEGARQQRALYELADHLHRARSLDDVYDAALDAILSALPCDGAAILLFDDAGMTRFAGWRGLSDGYRKAVEGHSPWKADERYPEQICINDVDGAEIDDSLKAAIKSECISALAFISLVSRGKLIGKLMTYFNAPHVFSDDELRLSLTIARQLAFGIDRKRDEELLRQNAAQLTLITNTAPIFIAHFDAQARFKFVNKPYAEMFGLTPEDFIGKGLPEAIGPEAYESLRQYIEVALSGKPVEIEVEVPYAAIGRHFMHSSYAPEFDASGKVVGFVAAIADISERKWAEQEIARLLADERSAREVAEHATRAKDEFLAVVSHELRSPLNSILGWNRLLRSQWGDNPEIAKVAEAVERSGKAQLQLIEDLLDTARIITGKMKLEFQPVEPVAVISAALDIIRPAADSKGVVIATDLDPNSGQITGDPDRLQQVIWNLLSNAIKFTPGGGSVQLELRRSGAGVQIVVRDTGQGIGPDLLPYVFDRFKQGDSTISRRYGGLGLGLALVKHLVELHGGSVGVESPGEAQGATFTVNLPVRAVKADGGTEGERIAGTAVDRGRAGRRAQTARVEGLAALVVDDDCGARELLAATLQQYGVLVTSADSAEAALAALESQFGDEATEPFDILISDIGMPGADGYELMRLVRAHPDRRVSRIPAIALTAYARTEDRLRALQSGFQMHVPKPVDEEELTTVIAALTDRI
jgi:PAS domain S-box-containing protein